jgi:hypothetical protein
MDTPALPLADLPPRPFDAWRQHTAKNWKSSAPDSYAICVEMITQHGITNISDLERQLETLGVKKSRQTIAALIRTEFSIEQLADLAAKNAAIARLQGTSKMAELIPDAKKSDLMSVGMATKMSHDIERSLNGMPTEIKAVVTLSAQDRLAEARAKAAAAKAAALEQQTSTVIEAEILSAISANAELHRPCEAGSVARSGSPAKRESRPPQHEVPQSPAKRGIDQHQATASK